MAKKAFVVARGTDLFSAPLADLSDRRNAFDPLADLSDRRNAFDPLAGLSPEQAAAAMAGEDGVVVRAGAGTGKTRTLVARLGYLVAAKGVPPESIVAVTFTNKAAREIRERVAATLGAAVAARLVLGTFHSVSLRVMKRHLHLLEGLDRRFAIVDDADSAKLAQLAATTLRAFRATGDLETDARTAETMGVEASRAIKAWKAWGLTTEMVEVAGRQRRTDQEEKFARIYASYQDELRRRNMVDFGDLVLSVVSLFERHEDVLEAESSRVRHLLVDEAQDANPAQVKWARLLSSTHGQVTSIGDEDQSIFGFQGGFPQAIGRVAGPGHKVYPLTVNRRCTDQILEPAVALVGWNKRSEAKSLSSGRKGEPPALHLLANEREEAALVASLVKARIKAGTSPAEVAILLRSSWPMVHFEEALIKASVPYRVVGGTSLSEREEVKDIVAYVRLAFRPDDELAFGRIYNRPPRGLGAAAYAAIMEAAKVRPGRPLHEACVAVREGRKERGAEQWDDGLRRLADVLANLDLQAYSRDCTTSDLLGTILHERGGGYEAHARAEKDEGVARRRLQSLEILREIAEEEPSPDDFVKRVALSTDADGGGAARVRLSTIHSSKGLEWDHVYLPAFVDEVIPSPRAVQSWQVGEPTDPWNGPSGGGIEEERRLAHVAFTRARMTVFVSATVSRGGKKCYPSCFLPEAGLEAILAQDPFAGGGRVSSRAGPVKSGRKGFEKRRV